MPRKAEELDALAVKKLKEPGLYFVGGVAGLGLQITPSGSRSWILRAMVGGKRRDHGLGAFYGTNGLARAREKAQEARDKIRAGVDPIEEGRAARSKLKSEKARELTFAQAAKKYITTNKAGWRNEKHQAQWASTLETYANPVMGNLLVKDITVTHVTRVLEPIWQTKTETATRVRQRVERVLDWAIASGFREGPNPAIWKGNLQMILPAPTKVAKVEHHAALPISEVGAFMVGLRRENGIAPRCLEFAILTAMRSGEVRGVTWSEIDLHSKVWTIPGSRMKAGREHRVPLSEPAIALLRALPRAESIDLLFPSPTGGMLSDMALTALTRRMKADCVPHGFRSSFRDWCAERTAYPHELAEMALAHTIANKTEAAYRRGDLFEKRRKLMKEWAEFVGKIEKKPAARKGNVVDIGKARSAA
jgi:integrase